MVWVKLFKIIASGKYFRFLILFSLQVFLCLVRIYTFPSHPPSVPVS